MKNKKILIFDDSIVTIQQVQALISMFPDTQLIVELNYKKIANSYTYDKYEYMIIDHNCKNSDELINYIHNVNTQQKIILLSDNINCPIDCKTCLDLFKLIRLLKPVNLLLVQEYINKSNEFTCPNQFRFDSINTIEKLYEIINLEEYRFYTKKNIENDKLIISSISSHGIIVEEIDKVISHINEKYFTFNILGDSIIVSNK